LCWNQDTAIKKLKVDLQDVLLSYLKDHPGCPYAQLEYLTPEQIIELDKKYMDPDYDLVLEW